MSDDLVQLGFAEEFDKPLSVRDCVSKIGGRCLWPTRIDSLLKSSRIECDKCLKRLALLLQIHAPLEEEDDWQRYLYVFICLNPTCCGSGSGNFKLLRLNFKNFDEDCERIGCVVCGLPSPFSCAKCHSASYCCKKHQAAHWRISHSAECGREWSDASRMKDGLTFVRQGLVLKEFEIVVEEEREESDCLGDVTEAKANLKLLSSSVKLSKSNTAEKCEDSTEMSALRNVVKIDKTFERFHARMSRDPEQVLRYDLIGGRPLMAVAGTPGRVEKCERCGSERRFEFQIMPQLIAKLALPNDMNSIDWATILCYTCANNCKESSSALTDVAFDLILKQDFSAPS